MNPLHYEISSAIEPFDGLPSLKKHSEGQVFSPHSAWIAKAFLIRGRWKREWHPVNWNAPENKFRLLEMMARETFIVIGETKACDKWGAHVHIWQLDGDTIAKAFMARKRIEKHPQGVK